MKFGTFNLMHTNNFLCDHEPTRVAYIVASSRSLLCTYLSQCLFLYFQETEGVCVVVLENNKGKLEGKKAVRKNNNDDDDDDGSRDQSRTKEDEMSKSKEIGRVKFPSFFTAESQFSAPYSLSDELQAAHLVNSTINFGLDSGILIAVPIPKVIIQRTVF
jgi:hypothetical protein